MNKKLNFEVQNVSIDDSMPNSKFAKISLDFFSSGNNAHELYVSEEVLNKTADTIFNVPIVWEYDALLDDAGSHDPLEVPCGFVKDGAEIERVRLPDGRLMLKTIGYIWKRYSGRLMEILERDDGKKPVSVEMSIHETKIDEDGKESLMDYVFEAITILGTFIEPAIESAGLNVLSFSQEKDDYNRAYSLEFAKYAELDFNIPKKMKANAKIGLDLRSKRGNGGTAVAVSLAKYIIRENKMSPEKARQIAKYFSRNNVSLPSDKEGIDWISWNLYGGTISAKLTKKLVEEIDAEDENLMAYFEQGDIPHDNALGNNSEGKEKNMKKEKEEKEVFEEKEAEDEEVSMAEKDAPETEDDAKEEEMAVDEDAEEEDMAADEGEDEEDVDMGSDEKKYENLFIELEAKFTTLEGEIIELREFKANIEQKQFEIKVESVLETVKHLFDVDGMSELRKDAVENYSLETLSGWENLVKSKAFTISENLPAVEEDKDDGVLKMAVVTDTTVAPLYDSLWE